jgi:hypothetical protein
MMVIGTSTGLIVCLIETGRCESAIRTTLTPKTMSPTRAANATAAAARMIVDKSRGARQLPFAGGPPKASALPVKN